MCGPTRPVNAVSACRSFAPVLPPPQRETSYWLQDRNSDQSGSGYATGHGSERDCRCGPRVGEPAAFRPPPPMNARRFPGAEPGSKLAAAAPSVGNPGARCFQSCSGQMPARLPPIPDMQSKRRILPSSHRDQLDPVDLPRDAGYRIGRLRHQRQRLDRAPRRHAETT